MGGEPKDLIMLIKLRIKLAELRLALVVRLILWLGDRETAYQLGQIRAIYKSFVKWGAGLNKQEKLLKEINNAMDRRSKVLDNRQKALDDWSATLNARQEALNHDDTS